MRFEERSSSASTWAVLPDREPALHRDPAPAHRAFRARHRGLPKGRPFPLSRDDLIECSAFQWCQALQ
jgi:hypothetical protein